MKMKIIYNIVILIRLLERLMGFPSFNDKNKGQLGNYQVSFLYKVFQSFGATSLQSSKRPCLHSFPWLHVHTNLGEAAVA